jgi:hypothetical protein
MNRAIACWRLWEDWEPKGLGLVMCRSVKWVCSLVSIVVNLGSNTVMLVRMSMTVTTVQVSDVTI